MSSQNESPKMKHAKGVYLDGIRDGRPREAMATHTGERYTQHSAGVADGKQGFIHFFETFVKRNPVRDIRIVRALEDGPHVFLHVHQNLNDGEAEWVTGDIFETDGDGKVIEHWDVIQAYAHDTRSGRTMVDGPTEIEDLDKTEANKAVVQRFFDEVLLKEDYGRVTEFMSSEQYHQHNPSARDGIEGYREHVEEITAKGETGRYWKLHKLVGQGNFVATLAHAQMGKSHYAFIDLFRLKDGKLVEHWDVQEKILPPEEWNNQGKF